jgi:hypothetical protein
MDDETAIWHVFYFIFSFGMNSIGSLTGGNNTTGKESNADAKKTTFPGLV